MPEHLWSNDELRTFFTALRSGSIFDRGSAVDDEMREAFRLAAMSRAVPAVERRVLADIGAVVDPRGVAQVVYEVAEDSAWGPEHSWLMVTGDPWSHLAELAVREIRASYRKTVRPRGEAKTLNGIETVSSRRAVDPSHDGDADSADADGER